MSPYDVAGSQATTQGASQETTPFSQSSLKPTGSQIQPLTYCSNESQDTSGTNDVDRVFTPPESDSGSSAALGGNGNASSQDSQLLQLSQIAAAQEKMKDASEIAMCGQSRKRMADGAVKHTRDSPSISPIRMAHSRNTSTVSVASTAGSRIGELSAELKAKLSYAMVKVNHGWQAHSIDEVESLASQVTSPTSSTSTLHGRYGASASPRKPGAGMRLGSISTGMSPVSQQPPAGRTYESFWRESNARAHHASTSPPLSLSHIPTLAPPAAIRPRQAAQSNSRRNSNTRYAPAYLSHASPQTPGQPSPLQSTPGTRIMRTPKIDPILFSPHQNVREQEALETLVFMSSPGNSANLKHNFSSSQTATSQPRNGTSSSQRTALPTSRLGPGAAAETARKALPAGRSQQTHGAGKRVGYDKSPSTISEMEVDDQYHNSPHIRGTPRRRGAYGGGHKQQLSVSSGLSGLSRPRPALKDDDIERMLDRVAADDSSDSEGEITLPSNRRRDLGASVGV